ncbi:branched-chain amino acid aminotransferase [Aliiroseovarius lamellibrachiae]|uniref:branched-chain amino acid aminotransferase n=1 Tax=Aliiroseovarius lamellibrachiae TaxID=1924933 RepID=UPI001BE01356|nr:branched-chain amino acid aminotransferase [Aliiroseovarius lamellibrachiae]MBT2130473.1 branched-chain amino acid aminotransferase [Aliiroseovarius lamellibrachiae]
MASGSNIRTYFNGQWHNSDVAVMKAADHGSWLGTTVFDGARFVDGVAPDLDAHCARVNRSAEALMITPTVDTDAMVEIVREGLSAYSASQAIYIRPMYWAVDGGEMGILPREGSTGFAVCLEEIPMAPPTATTTLTTTRFCRPTLDSAVVNAKAGCLYPNNARMMAEAKSKGYGNALVADALGNVAESASSNVFIVRDGEVFTPIPNGTFLAGITRARHMENMRADGMKVHEVVMSFDDVRAADEVFLSGNMSKLTPVTEFDGTQYNSGEKSGPVTARVRDMYWDWAHSGQ